MQTKLKQTPDSRLKILFSASAKLPANYAQNLINNYKFQPERWRESCERESGMTKYFLKIQPADFSLSVGPLPPCHQPCYVARRMRTVYAVNVEIN